MKGGSIYLLSFKGNNIKRDKCWVKNDNFHYKQSHVSNDQVYANFSGIDKKCKNLSNIPAVTLRHICDINLHNNVYNNKFQSRSNNEISINSIQMQFLMHQLWQRGSAKYKTAYRKLKCFANTVNSRYEKPAITGYLLSPKESLCHYTKYV